MAYNIKKFLDSSGIRHFVNLLNNYPNNEILSTVIDAIQDELDNKKNTQTAVSSPIANGNALAFIDEISQNTQGVITATKKNVTVDATPTANSTNPVQSGGVKAALDEKLNTIGKGTNLLDNWYFVGGGSQQGGRQFPINQRGQTSYTGNAYGIDRWRTSSWQSTPTVLVGSDGVRLVGDAGDQYNNCLMRQKIGNASSYAGKQLTASAIISNIASGASIRLFIAINNNDRYTKVIFNSTGLYSVTFQVPSDTESMDFIIGQNASDAGKGNTDIVILATKLELGDTQTLAHQENGEWVLNDPPPDYGMELLKCQLSTADSSDTYANRKLIPITANMGTVTGTGNTVTVTKIVTGVTSAMTVDRIEFGNPSAVQSGWTVTTAADSLTFSAVISGSTTVKIKLSDNMDVTGT